MNSITTAVLMCSLLVAAVQHVNSFPTGAGGCMGGMAAVGGSHLGEIDSRVVSNSTLETGGVMVRIGNIILDPNTPIDLDTSVDHIITINSTEFPVRGILIRVEANGVDATTNLIPGSSTQVATACEAPIVGTTHIDSSDKIALTSVIRFDEEIEGVILDVTGVFVNGVDGSVFIYSRYLVNFRSTAPATSAPSDTNAPTMITVPTASPSFMDTDSPSDAPIDLETTEPTTSPVTAETASPTQTPVAVETASPTLNPIAVETTSPTTSPTGMVVSDEPSGSPVVAPTSMETFFPAPSEKTSEPSLRGGKGMKKGMMSKGPENTPTKSPDAKKKGMMKGMMMKEGGKGKKEKKDMKKSKDEAEIMDKKHSMGKLSKKDDKIEK